MTSSVFTLALPETPEILKVIEDEERTFGTALNEVCASLKTPDQMCQTEFSGQAAFRLYDSRIPVELSEELSRRKSLARQGFPRNFLKTKRRSSSAGRGKGLIHRK